MKDIISNRRRVGLWGKLKILRLVLRENGIVWTLYLLIYHFGSSLSDWAFTRMDRLRREKGLPGMNSTALNAEIWNQWDWTKGGEEWTQSEEWKASLIQNVLNANVPEGGNILEIGPGAGRWTEHLLKRAKRLTGIDISKECVVVCRRKFADFDNVAFHTNDGSSLTLIEDSSVDTIWSFDVFVHINESDVAEYAEEFARVLRTGGRGIIHHGTVAGKEGGWRSDLTVTRFNEILKANGLRLISQFDEWEDNGKHFKAGLYQDGITVFPR